VRNASSTFSRASSRVRPWLRAPGPPVRVRRSRRPRRAHRKRSESRWRASREPTADSTPHASRPDARSRAVRLRGWVDRQVVLARTASQRSCLHRRRRNEGAAVAMHSSTSSARRMSRRVSRAKASQASASLLSMAKQRHTQIDTGIPLKRAARTQPITGRAEALQPATRSLRDVLAERGPLTGPITDAGTRALLAVRGERPDGGHGSR
jgi:hypothetical protein